MTDLKNYYSPGDLLQIKEQVNLYFYGADDPDRMYYERETLNNQPVVILDLVVAKEEIRFHGPIRSYKILSSFGVGYVVAQTKDYEYSYYNKI